MPPAHYRTSLRKPNTARARPSPVAEHSRLDVWLNRGSHIAQVGLFALTFATLFYTVIPLYKTAALEEQIARREAELKSAEKKVATVDAALREANEKAYRRVRADILWNLSFQAGPRCSGLLRPPEAPISLDSASQPRPERPLLDINVAECMATELSKLNAKSALRAEDWGLLSNTVQQAGDSLERQRSEAIAAIRSMPEKSNEEIYAIAPKGPYSRKVDEWFAKVHQIYPELKTRDAQIERRSAVRHGQEKVARDFEELVRVEIRKLGEITWPQPNSVK